MRERGREGVRETELETEGSGEGGEKLRTVIKIIS